MSIRIKCECGSTLEASDDQRGQKAKCPECGQIVKIPDFPTLKRVPDQASRETAKPVTRSPASQKAARTPTRNPLATTKPRVTTMAMLGAGTGLVVAGICRTVIVMIDRAFPPFEMTEAQRAVPVNQLMQFSPTSAEAEFACLGSMFAMFGLFVLPTAVFGTSKYKTNIWFIFLAMCVTAWWNIRNLDVSTICRNSIDVGMWPSLFLGTLLTGTAWALQAQNLEIPTSSNG